MSINASWGLSLTPNGSLSSEIRGKSYRVSRMSHSRISRGRCKAVSVPNGAVCISDGTIALTSGAGIAASTDLDVQLAELFEFLLAAMRTSYRASRMA
jgi:hypothetical protein